MLKREVSKITAVEKRDRGNIINVLISWKDLIQMLQNIKYQRRKAMGYWRNQNNYRVEKLLFWTTRVIHPFHKACMTIFSSGANKW